MICSIKGCDKVCTARKLCRKHYASWWYKGDPSLNLKTKHSMCNSPEYNSWRGILKRCYQSSHDSYPNYGGRGIEVCERWRDSFETFYKDMGKKPSSEYSIDRIDNDSDYTPENCRWATKSEQSTNQRLRKTNKSGYKGVYPDRGRWAAAIKRDGEQRYLGRFDTPQEAFEAYQRAAEVRDATVV